MKFATILMATCAMIGATSARAETSAEPTAPQPKLIVAISVDQFSTDLFNEYRANFTGGLKRLADGVAFPNGYQSHAATETCPGHSTVLTGMHPTETGIPANDWINPETGQEVYCLAAPQNHLAHGRDDTDNGPVGPEQLRATTLGDWLKAVSPESKVVAVSGKDRGAITLAGHQGDGAFWLTEGFGFDFNRCACTFAVIPVANTQIARYQDSVTLRPRGGRIDRELPETCDSEPVSLTIDPLVLRTIESAL